MRQASYKTGFPGVVSIHSRILGPMLKHTLTSSLPSLCPGVWGTTATHPRHSFLLPSRRLLHLLPQNRMRRHYRHEETSPIIDEGVS
jgi:hypothetical protein